MSDSTIFRNTKGTIGILFDQIDRGELGLPELQRPFVWGTTKVRDLFDSMYRGYPIGYFLFWANDSDDQIKVKQIGKNEKDAIVPRSLIIDGQQRLTALYCIVKNRSVINKDFKSEKIVISFNPILEAFKVANATTIQNKEYIPDISKMFESSTFTFINSYLKQLEEYKEKVEANKVLISKRINDGKTLNTKEIEFIVTRFNQLEEVLEEQEFAVMKLKDKIPLTADDKYAILEFLNKEIIYNKDEIAARINRLAQLKEYPYEALEINSNVDEEVVAEIFTRINSKGTILNQADFVLTLLSVFWEKGRKIINDYCESFTVVPDNKTKPSPYNHLCNLDAQDVVRINIGVGFKRGRMKDAYAILKGRDLVTRRYNVNEREKQFEVFKKTNKIVIDNTNWHRFISIITSCGFKNKEFLSSKNALIYSYTLFLICLSDYKYDHKELEKLISKWFFMVTLTSRYSSSPESQMESDLNRIKDCKTTSDLTKFINNTIQSVLTNDFWDITLPKDLLVTSSANSPAGNVFFACQIKNGEKALFSDKHVGDLFDPTLKLKKKSLDRHHIFPSNYLKNEGFQQIERNQIANMVYLEFLLNIDISDDPPKKYMANIKAKYYLGKEDKMKKELENHSIPSNFFNMDYNSFLEMRRVYMANYIRKTFESL